MMKIKLSVGDKVIVESSEQIMVLEVLKTKDSDMLVYRPIREGEDE